MATRLSGLPVELNELCGDCIEIVGGDMYVKFDQVKITVTHTGIEIGYLYNGIIIAQDTVEGTFEAGTTFLLTDIEARSKLEILN
jgi:hypothetical protein